MKLLAIIRKCFLEQIRQFWILLLTISMAACFVGIFYAIYKSETLHLDVRVVVSEQISDQQDQTDYSAQLVDYLNSMESDTVPIRFRLAVDRNQATDLVQNRKADALLILPEKFSSSLADRIVDDSTKVPFELSGDMSDTYYMLAAIWTHAFVTEYITQNTGEQQVSEFVETPMGQSANMDDFSMAIPGLLILATIMLMFSGAIAFVSEPEKGTMIRLKISKMSPFSFIGGVTFVQTIVGFLSILLTLATASLFGFSFTGSFWLFFLVCLLTCISVIGFSLILAGLTKTVNEILVVGNFPLFLFMFFSGTMFPIHGKTLFTLGGYDFTIPGMMSTYHGVEALKKVTIFESGIQDIWPELVCLSGLSVIYFIVGFWIYRKRHMTF